ncbi:MAG: IS1595 family transposase [Bacteroidota bacterium]
MHGSKLPFLYWFKAMHLMSSDKSGISALALQKELGHKRYEPIWKMMHKLRSIMGQRDNKYKMEGTFEMDEAFFEHVILNGEERERIATEGPKRGTSSEEKSKVLVMVGSEPVTGHNPKKHDKKRRCGFIKMQSIPDLKATTIEEKGLDTVDKSASVVTDASNSYVNLKTLLKEHTAYNLPSKETSKALPWVHTAISNARRKLEGTFYMVSDKYIGYYLDEFCYMFNRKLFKCKFDRLIIAAAAIKHDLNMGKLTDTHIIIVSLLETKLAIK